MYGKLGYLLYFHIKSAVEKKKLVSYIKGSLWMENLFFGIPDRSQIFAENVALKT